METKMPVFVTDNDTIIFPSAGIKEIYTQMSRGGWQVMAAISGAGTRTLASGLSEAEKDLVMAEISSGLLEGIPVINFSKKISSLLKEKKQECSEDKK